MATKAKAKLSWTMRDALRKIAEKAPEAHGVTTRIGGWPTVEALQRRGLVEIARPPYWPYGEVTLTDAGREAAIQ